MTDAATSFSQTLSNALWHGEPQVTITTAAGRRFQGEVVEAGSSTATLQLGSTFLILALAAIESIEVSSELVRKMAEAEERVSERRLAQRQALQDAQGAAQGWADAS